MRTVLYKLTTDLSVIIIGRATITRGAIIGAAAVVDFEVPPFSVVAGNPAKIRSKINH